MRRFVIQRDLPGAGQLTQQQLEGIAKTSNKVLAEMGPGIQWEHSYVTGDKVFCVYLSESEAKIREHAKRGGFPATEIFPVVQVIDPLTEKSA